MTEKSEKTRVTNFIKKIMEVDLSNIREVADQYRQLDDIVKLAKKEMDILKKTLVEAEVSEYFLEEETKVVYEEGRQKSYLNTEKVYNLLPLPKFLEVATVTETAIKRAYSDEVKVASIVSGSKEILEEKTAPSIKVGKMTKKELKEML